MRLEEFFRRTESFGKEAPQTLPADFATRTIKPKHWPPGMFDGGLTNLFADAKPVAYGGNFPKGNSGLCHPIRPRIHAQKQNALASGRKPAQIRLVCFPGVIQGIVNM